MRSNSATTSEQRNRHSLTMHNYDSDNSDGRVEEETIQPEVKSCLGEVKKFTRKRLPILQWFPTYQKSYVISDLIAGITVWLTAVPQSMAYAAIAGLTPEYGLYSHFVGPFVYIFLGSCRQVTIGPTAVIELVTFQTCGYNFPECVILVGFYSGIIQLIFALLNLGLIVSFISQPVTVGFTAGAACIISSAQVKNLLGLSGRANGSAFYAIWQHIVENITTIKLGDTVLGVLCMILLLVFRKLKDINLPERYVGSSAERWKKVLGQLSLARNALIVLCGGLIAFSWGTSPPFKLTGAVQSGFPPVQVPSFELLNPHSNSTTPMTFTETLSFLKTGPLIVAFIAILQNVAISKAFGSGQTIDGTQEMLALGTMSVIGGFFSSIPTSGSFSRSAINDASGVKSQLGGLFVGTLILLSLGILTPAFQYIPKASLAAVIIGAMIFMIEFETIILIWRSSKLDFLCCFVTFICALLFGMEYGIMAGVGVSLLVILLKSVRPSVSPQLLTDTKTHVKYILLQPDQGLYFPSVDFIRDTVNKLAVRYVNYPVIVIQCDKWTKWDFTSVSALVSLGKSLNRNGKTLILYKNNACWEKILHNFFGAPQYPHCCSTKSQLHEYFLRLKPKHYNSSSRSSSSSTESLATMTNNPTADCCDDDNDDDASSQLVVPIKGEKDKQEIV